MIYNLKNRVMARIYMEFVKNAILRRIEYILPGAFLLALFASVSAQSIFHNMPKDRVANTFNFLVIAVRNTEWAIQLVFGATLLCFFYVIARLTYKNAAWFKHLNIFKLSPKY